MKKRTISLLLTLAMVLSLVIGIPVSAGAVNSNTNPDGNSEYISVWHTSPLWASKDSDSSTAVRVLGALRERTFRTRVQVTVPLKGQIQLTFSNEYDSVPLEIGEVTVAKGSPTDINVITSSALRVTFNNALSQGKMTRGTSYYGATVNIIPAKGVVTSDPIDVTNLKIDAMDYLTISTWVTNMGSHDDGFTTGLTGGRTSYLGLSVGGDSANGFNHTEATNLNNVGMVSPVELSRSDDTGDYNLIPFLTEIDLARSSTDHYATVIFGDSTLANEIPNMLGSRLNANSIEGVSFVSSAIKGNELLLDGQDASDDHNGSLLGKAGLTRIDSEALDLPGVKKVIVKLGINDILHPYCSNLAQNYDHLPTAAEIINGYQTLITKAHNKGIEIYFYELSPWQGYTRNDTISYSDSIDAIRREVNQWLAENGKNYDDFSDDFSSFGYIPLDSMNDSGDANKLKAGFTTDGIHYTKSGQNQVSSLTPTSIFWKTEDGGDKLGESVTIDGIYFATSALTANNTYFITNSNAASVYSSANSNQETKGYALGNPGVETTDKNYYVYGGISSINDPVSAVTEDQVTIQRGTSGAPYVVDTSSLSRDKWLLEVEDENHFWSNTIGNNTYYLAWYFPRTSFFDTVYTTGVRLNKPQEEFDITDLEDRWFAYNRIQPKSDYQSRLYYDGSIDDDKELIYRSSGGNHWSAGFNTIKDASRLVTNLVDNWPRELTLYDTTTNGVLAKLDIIQGSAPSIPLDEDDETIVIGKKTTDKLQLYYQLKSDKTVGDDHVPSGVEVTDNGISNSNNAAGPFKLYTFGTDQYIFWTSSNPDVLTVSQSNGRSGGGEVAFTGMGGTSVVSLNYFWKEFDGTDYVFDNNNNEYYTEAQKDAAIADGTKPESDEVEGYHWFYVGKGNGWVYTNYHYLTSDTAITNVVDFDTDILLDGKTDDGTAEDTFNVVDVTPTSKGSLEALKITDPVGVDVFEEGDHWVWESSDETIATITQDGSEFATLNYTGKTGTTTVTVKYVDENGDVVKDHMNGDDITSSITVNTTEKPVTVDIKIKGEVTDYYANAAASAGIRIPLEAFIDYGTITDGTYSWKVYNENGEESSSVISLSPNNDGPTPTAVIMGDGIAYAVVTYSYTNTAGAPATATSAVLFNITTKTIENKVLIDYSAKYKIDDDVYSVDPIDDAEGFDLTDPVPGTLTYQLPSSKTDSSYNLTTFASSASAMYYTGAEMSDENTVCHKVTVIPASNVYYDDDLEDKTLEVGQKVKGDASDTNSINAAKVSEDDSKKILYFTFKGTAVDVYCTTDSESEYVQARIYKGAGADACVSENKIGKSKTIRNQASVSRYNTPTIRFTAEELGSYGTYTLWLNVMKDSKFKLDGIRVYGALDNDQDAYSGTDDQFATYVNLRDMLLNDGLPFKPADVTNPIGSDTSVDYDVISGVLFMDAASKEHFKTLDEEGQEDDLFDNAIAAYTSDGPKSEIYLSPGEDGPGQELMFKLKDWNTKLSGAKVFIGLSAPENGNSAFAINNGDSVDVKSYVDQYYQIVPDENGNVTITNTGSGLLSVTNLKITGVDLAKTSQSGTDTNSTLSSAKLRTLLFAPMTRNVIVDAVNEDPAVTGDDPADPGDDPADPGDDPTDPGDDPAVTGDDPADPGDDPAVTGDDPADPGDDPAVTGDDPADSGDDPAVSGDDSTPTGGISNTIASIVKSFIQKISSLIKSLFRR